MVQLNDNFSVKIILWSLFKIFYISFYLIFLCTLKHKNMFSLFSMGFYTQIHSVIPQRHSATQDFPFIIVRKEHCR
jgi:hypothetical protein